MIAWLLAALAQTASGVVNGQVLNPQHLPAPSAKVVVQQAGKNVATAVTDANGIYSITLPQGDYIIRVDSVTKTVSIKGDKPLKLDIELSEAPAFFDEPQFTVAGVTDNTYRGGHGSDTILRSSETLTKATASLSSAGEAEAEPHHRRAEQQERAGDPLEAVKEFQKAAELNPSERNLFDWGTELLSHKAPLPAAQVFSKGHSQRMILGQAASWYAAGSYAKAAHCFFEAIDGHPDDPAPYGFLFNAQSQEILQTPGYLERFSRFATAHPDNALAQYYYGAALWRVRQDAEALPFLQKAVTMDPKLASAQLELGIVYFEQRQYQQAINAYQLAVKQDPSLEEAHYRLSEAYRVTGDHAESQRELAIYRTLSKESAEKLEKERREVQQFVVDLKSQ